MFNGNEASQQLSVISTNRSNAGRLKNGWDFSIERSVKQECGGKLLIIFEKLLFYEVLFIPISVKTFLFWIWIKSVISSHISIINFTISIEDGLKQLEDSF